MKKLYLLILLFVATSIHSEIYVDFGYMDEEQSKIHEAIKKAKEEGRKVIILERKDIKDSKKLFEKPMSYYTDDGKISVDFQIVGGDAPSLSSADSFEKRLGQKIHDAVVDPKYKLALEQSIAAGAPLKNGYIPKDGGRPVVKTEMTLVTFNADKADPSKAPLVVYRTRNMGAQASEIQVEADTIFKTLADMPEASKAKGGIHGISVTVGGAISPEALPGSWNKIDSTVYVGFETVITEDGSKKYAAVVKTANFEEGEKSFYYKLFDDRESAEDDAIKKFIKTPDELNHNGVKLSEVMNKIKSDPKKALTLTSSRFLGDELKEAGRKLCTCIKTAQMEDFQMIMAAKKAGFDSLSIVRGNADPYKIDSAFKKKVAEWSANHKYTKADYIDAIIWGQEGSVLGELPKSGFWDVFKGMKKTEIEKYATPFLHGRRYYTIDPIYAEIASDFLADAMKGELFTSSKTQALGMISNKVLDSLTPAQLEMLEVSIKTKNDKIKLIANDVEQFFKNNLHGGKLSSADRQVARKKLISLMDELHSLDLTEYPDLKKVLLQNLDGEKLKYLQATGKVRMLGAQNALTTKIGDEFEMAIRFQKFGGGSAAGNARTADHLVGATQKELYTTAMTLGDADVDRMLYKVGTVTINQTSSPAYLVNVIDELPEKVQTTKLKIRKEFEDLIEKLNFQVNEKSILKDGILKSCFL